LLPPTRIVEKIARERRAPIFEHADERAARTWKIASEFATLIGGQARGRFVVDLSGA
jgi:hypothetical protein